MRPNRYILVLSILGVALLGAWWMAYAQEARSPWGPPTVVPGEEDRPAPVPPKKGTFVTYPRTPQPKNPKAKTKSPAAGLAAAETSGLQQTAGQVPEPPPLPQAMPVPKIPPPQPAVPTLDPAPETAPPALPALESAGKVPVMPLPELPTKPVVEKPSPLPAMASPLFPEVKPEFGPNTKTTAPLDVAAPKPASKTSAEPVPPPKPPAPLVPEAKAELPVLVIPSPALKSPAVSQPETKPATPAPVINLEPKAPAPLAVTPAPSVETKPATPGGVKAFVPLRPVSRPIAPQPSVVPPAANTRVLPAAPAPPMPIAPKNAAGALASAQVPALTIEKRGPAVLRPGEKLIFQIVVRNPGSSPAHQVKVEDEAPPGATLIAADPAPVVSAGKVVWSLPLLGPQSEAVLHLALQVGEPISFNHRVSVTASSAASPANSPVAAPPAAPPVASSVAPAPAEQSTVALRPRLQADVIGVRLLSPTSIAVGKPVLFDIHVTNQSSQPQGGLVLYGYLPEGLRHPEGPNIKGPFDGVLQPGETRTLRMPATAVKAGRYSVAVKVTTGSGHESSATGNITIASDTLDVQQGLTGRLFVGREADCRIELTNHTGRVLRNVTVINELPEGLEFVAASAHGLYQANRRSAHWVVDQILPGQTQALLLRLHATRPGQYPHAVSVKADNTPEIKSAGTIVVEGVSGLSLKVIDRDNPLEVGRETVYEVQVANPGTTPSTNVKLQVLFPPGLTPRNAQGTTQHLVAGQMVEFAPLPALGPQGEAIYRVSAVAQTVGDQRVRFAVVSDQTPTPITREKGTWVYRD